MSDPIPVDTTSPRASHATTADHRASRLTQRGCIYFEPRNSLGTRGLKLPSRVPPSTFTQHKTTVRERPSVLTFPFRRNVAQDAQDLNVHHLRGGIIFSHTRHILFPVCFIDRPRPLTPVLFAHLTCSTSCFCLYYSNVTESSVPQHCGSIRPFGFSPP